MSDPDRIPTWPGPRPLLPAYSAGWNEFNTRVVAATDTGESPVDDPAHHVPPGLDRAARLAWIAGWCECMLASATVESARQAGVTDPAALLQIAIREVQEYRAGYLPTRPPKGRSH